jgi:hypothetical protein
VLQYFVMRLYWFLLALCASIALAIAHYVALTDYLYWTYRWLDSPMHVLGGFALGSLLIAFLFRFRPWKYIVGMLLVAVGWEFFEALIGMQQPADYVLDTATDVLCDGVGASVAYLLARITIWRSV